MRRRARGARSEGLFAAWGPATDLRVLFAGHADVFTLVAHQASGIRAMAACAKRIGIGSPGSRQRAKMARVMAAFGLTRNDFAEVRELSPAEQNRAFCANEVDAIVYSVSHPNGLVRDATLTCNGMLVAVSGPALDRMLSGCQEYERDDSGRRKKSGGGSVRDAGRGTSASPGSCMARMRQRCEAVGSVMAGSLQFQFRRPAKEQHKQLPW